MTKYSAKYRIFGQITEHSAKNRIFGNIRFCPNVRTIWMAEYSYSSETENPVSFEHCKKCRFSDPLNTICPQIGVFFTPLHLQCRRHMCMWKPPNSYHLLSEKISIDSTQDSLHFQHHPCNLTTSVANTPSHFWCWWLKIISALLLLLSLTFSLFLQSSPIYRFHRLVR